MKEYVVTDYDLKELWRGQAEDDKQALTKSRLEKGVEDGIVYLAKNWDEAQRKKLQDPKSETAAGESGVNSERQQVSMSKTVAAEKKSRKTLDKAKKGRRSPEYFVFNGVSLSAPMPKDEAEQILLVVPLEGRGKLRVIIGHETDFTFKVQGL